VPEPAEHHRDHEVARLHELAVAVAAERDVEEVAQKARERDVPAPPELAEAQGAIGAVEVLREDEAQEQRDADRDVGVAREVAEDLHGVGVGGEQDVGCRVGLRDAEDRIDDLAREEVGDRHLLHEADDDERDAGADGDLARIARALELGQELARADDRAGDDVGEEAQVQPDVDRLRGRQQAAVDVDGVGDGLEDDEADADRQRDRRERQRQPEADLVEQRVGLLCEEPVVLEDAERREVQRDRDADDEAPAALVLRAVHELRRGLVAERHAGEQHAELRARRAVEEVARGEHERLPDVLASHERPREREHDREEDCKLDRREDHCVGRLRAGRGRTLPGPVVRTCR
jgi:hypothetical protein